MINVFSYASTSVTSSSYVTLVVATPITISKLMVTDSSGQLMKIAVGPVGHEVDLFSCPVSGSIVIPIYLTSGQRLSVKAINTTASSGYNVVSFLE